MGPNQTIWGRLILVMRKQIGQLAKVLEKTVERQFGGNLL
jgi:hypothetical protein